MFEKKKEVFQALVVTSFFRNVGACRLCTEGPPEKATIEWWSNNAIIWISTRGSGIFFQQVWDMYIYLLTGLKTNLVCVLNWLPPVIFSPLCLEPAPVLVLSLSFYLVSRSCFYFCLASESVRFSLWYLLYIFFIAPFLWNVKSSCCLSIHLC